MNDTVEYLLSVSLSRCTPVVHITLGPRSFYGGITHSPKHAEFSFTREIDLDLQNLHWDQSQGQLTATVSLRQELGARRTQLTLLEDTVSIPTDDRYYSLQWLDGENRLASLVVKDNKIQCVRLILSNMFVSRPNMLHQWELHQQHTIAEHNELVYRQVLEIKLKPVKKRLARLRQEMQDLEKVKRRKKDKYKAAILSCETKQKVVDYL